MARDLLDARRRRVCDPRGATDAANRAQREPLVRGGNFNEAQMEYMDLASANFRDATFQKADLRNATLQDADLTGANLSEADLEGTDLSKADLRHADFRNIKWQKITDVKLANVFGIKNAPPDFLKWALQGGAVSKERDTEWQDLLAGE